MPALDLRKALTEAWSGLGEAAAARLREYRPLRQAAHCVAVAAANLAHDRLRTAIALAGTAVPILLLILQLALLQAVRTEVVRLYRDFAFDIAILPATYEFLNSNGSFDRIRLTQAREVPGVAATFNLNIDGGAWTAGAGPRRAPVILIGIDDAPDFIADSDLRAGLDSLDRSDAVLVDRFSSPTLGPLEPGTAASINGHPVTVAGAFELGLFFYTDGAAVVKNVNLPPLTGGDARQTSIGLIQLAPGADPRKVQAELARILPPDVNVLRRSELIADEQAFFLSVKPLGLIVLISMIVAALAGTVVLWQVLSAEIARRIDEFATLSAIGFAPAFVLGVGFCETVLLGLGAFLPALLAGAAILEIIAFKTHLPAGITFGLALEVLAVVTGMCLLCAASVLHRIARAEPANLF